MSATFPALSTSLAGKANKSFAETLSRVKTRMDAFKRDAPGLGAAILLSVGALGGGQILRSRYQQAASRGSRFINLTNFGIIDESACSFGGHRPVEAYGVGPIQYAPGVLIAVSSSQDRLHLVVQGNDDQKFQPFIRGLLARMLCDLDVMAGLKNL